MSVGTRLASACCVALLVVGTARGEIGAAPGTAGRYSDHGLAFDYDDGVTVDTKVKDGDVTVSLKGPGDLDLSILLTELPLAADAFAESLVEGMRNGFKQGGAKVDKMVAVKRNVGGQERSGKGFAYSLLGFKMLLQIVGWDVAGSAPKHKAIVVTIQYPPESEAVVRPVIDRTLSSLRYSELK